jgi:hypothetical protein
VSLACLAVRKGAEAIETRAGSAFVPYLLVSLGLGLCAEPGAAQCQVDKLDLTSLDVAIDGDTLAVGWLEVSLALRHVDIYFEQAGDWVLQATFTQPGNPDGLYSWAVDIDGDTVVAGAQEDYLGGQIFAGRVFVYHRSGAVWTLEQELTPYPGSGPVGFGGALSIDGETLAVGEGFNPFTTAPGNVHVYVRQAGSWAKEAVLSASDPGTYDGFGSAVALEGDRLMVGAGQNYIPVPLGPGKVYAFERTGSTWSETQVLLAADPLVNSGFGMSLAFDGATLATGAGGSGSSVYAFVEDAGVWSQEAKLSLPATTARGVIGLSGDRLLVGAPWDDDLGSNAGAVLVFRRTGGVWAQEDKGYGDDTDEGDAFGQMLDWNGGRVAVRGGSQLYLFTFDDPNCPAAGFSGFPSEGRAPLLVAFTDESSGIVSSWSWTFGDGTSSAEQHPSHTFASKSGYTISLVASGPSGLNREVKVGYVLAHATASATFRNGSGMNRACFSSTSLPVLGGTWTAEIDGTGHPGATTTLILGYLQPIAGSLTPYGELLLHLRSGRALASMAVPDAMGIARHAVAVPYDLALDGMMVYAQGCILGGHPELCNALDLTAGY